MASSRSASCTQANSGVTPGGRDGRSVSRSRGGGGGELILESDAGDDVDDGVGAVGGVRASGEEGANRARASVGVAAVFPVADVVKERGELHDLERTRGDETLLGGEREGRGAHPVDVPPVVRAVHACEFLANERLGVRDDGRWRGGHGCDRVPSDRPTDRSPEEGGARAEERASARTGARARRREDRDRRWSRDDGRRARRSAPGCPRIKEYLYQSRGEVPRSSGWGLARLPGVESAPSRRSRAHQTAQKAHLSRASRVSSSGRYARDGGAIRAAGASLKSRVARFRRHATWFRVVVRGASSPASVRVASRVSSRIASEDLGDRRGERR